MIIGHRKDKRQYVIKYQTYGEFYILKVYEKKDGKLYSTTAITDIFLPATKKKEVN